MSFLLSRKIAKRVRFIPVGSMLPSSTIRREVSGNVNRTRSRQRPPRIDRNQNIHSQPSLAAITPPKTGPNGGATFGLLRHQHINLVEMDSGVGVTCPKLNTPTYEPLSAGVAMSDMTPYPSDMVPRVFSQLFQFSSHLSSSRYESMHRSFPHSASSLAPEELRSFSAARARHWRQNRAQARGRTLGAGRLCRLRSPILPV